MTNALRLNETEFMIFTSFSASIKHIIHGVKSLDNIDDTNTPSSGITCTSITQIDMSDSETGIDDTNTPSFGITCTSITQIDMSDSEPGRGFDIISFQLHPHFQAFEQKLVTSLVTSSWSQAHE